MNQTRGLHCPAPAPPLIGNSACELSGPHSVLAQSAALYVYPPGRNPGLQFTNRDHLH